MYQPYRGQRSRRRRRIRNIIIIVLSLLVIAGTVFLLFFQEHMIYSADGIRFEPPWGKGDTQTQEPENGGTVTGDGPAGDGQGGAQEGNDGAQEPVNAPQNRILALPAARLGDAAYMTQVVAMLENNRLSGAAMPYKDAAGAITAAETLAAPVQALHTAGKQAVAIVNAFNDNGYARSTPAAALRNVAGNAWRLPDGNRWLDPASDAAMAYVTAQLQACKDMGFDEVILQGFGYPREGNLGRIAYGEAYAAGAQRADLLARRLSELQAAMAPMKVSVVVDDATAQGGLNEASGQDVAKLYAAAAAVYVPMAVQTETSGDSIRTILGRLTGGETAKIVPMYTDQALAASLFAGEQSLYFTLNEPF